MNGRGDLNRGTWLTGAGTAMLLASGPAKADTPNLRVAFTLPDAVTDGVAVTPDPVEVFTLQVGGEPARNDQR